MQDGFIKTAVASPDIRVADVAYNTKSIIQCIHDAARNGAKLLVLPELCLTAYTCGDLFLQRRLQQDAWQGILKIARETEKDDILAAVGMPVEWNGKLYNAAAFLKGGKILGFVTKKNIPNYAEFYEARYFSVLEQNVCLHLDGPEIPMGSDLIFCCRQIPDLQVACEICEDLWVADSPSTGHALHGATVICNLSASNEVIGKREYRHVLVRAQSAKAVCAYLYADAGMGESTTDMVFAGHHMVYENGTLLTESRLFEEEICYADIDLQKLTQERKKLSTFWITSDESHQRIYFDLCPAPTRLCRKFEPLPFVPRGEEERTKRCEEIFALQYMGLAKRLRHIGAETVTIGISGGLDSTLALLVTAKAFDRLGLERKNIIAVTMPGFGTTGRTRGNAEKMIHCLGAQFREISIANAVRGHLQDIGASEQEHDVTYENAQARERTQILMDIANKTGGIVIGTGDLSELALGFATYNGDHMSMYGVNASVPKTLIRYLVRYVADHSDADLHTVLYDVLDTPVSPELLPPEENGTIAQKTESIVGPYELHDFFLYHVIRNGFDRDKILRMCVCAFEGEYNKATIEKWLDIFYRRFFNSQFKRSCLPDGPKVGSVALSPRGDWRMPSDACAALWLAELEQLFPQKDA